MSSLKWTVDEFAIETGVISGVISFALEDFGGKSIVFGLHTDKV